MVALVAERKLRAREQLADSRPATLHPVDKDCFRPVAYVAGKWKRPLTDAHTGIMVRPE